jgi:hypothetical protein
MLGLCCHGYTWFVIESHTVCCFHARFVIESHTGCHAYVWILIESHPRLLGHAGFVIESRKCCNDYACFVVKSHPGLLGYDRHCFCDTTRYKNDTIFVRNYIIIMRGPMKDAMNLYANMSPCGMSGRC